MLESRTLCFVGQLILEKMNFHWFGVVVSGETTKGRRIAVLMPEPSSGSADEVFRSVHSALRQLCPLRSCPLCRRMESCWPLASGGGSVGLSPPMHLL